MGGAGDFVVSCLREHLLVACRYCGLVIALFCIWHSLANAGEPIEKSSLFVLQGSVVEQTFIRLTVSRSGEAEERRVTLRRQELPPGALNFEGPQIQKVLSSLIPTDGERLCEFKLAGSGRGLDTYEDRDVRQAHFYAYWLVDEHAKVRAGPLGLKMRDPEVWWSQPTIEQKARGLVFRYPDFVRQIYLGQSAEGRPIRALVVGGTNSVAALIGNTHGGESGGELILYSAEQLLMHDQELLRNAGIVAVPALNIDARKRLLEGHISYIRKNARGVDLNRNFPAGWTNREFMYGQYNDDLKSDIYRGAAPASEPETKAALKLLAEYRPKAVVAYHWMGCLTGRRIQFCAGTQGYNQIQASFSEEYLKGFLGSDRSGDLSLFVRSVPSPGSLQRYCCEGLQIPCLVVEGDQRDDERERRAFNDQATPADLRIYQTRHYQAVRRLLQRVGAVASSTQSDRAPSARRPRSANSEQISWSVEPR
jgi:hypothetical protein